MRAGFNISKGSLGFSLAEVLAALTIGSMILATVLGIYSRVDRSAAAITDKLDSSRLPTEVLQRIAEDLDGIVDAGKYTKITISNKFDHNYATARLRILKTIYTRQNRNEPQKFEEIIWQTSYDYDSGLDGLVLYRSHSGIAMEDKLLDENKEDWEREVFVPICEGITFFSIQVSTGDNYLSEWNQPSLPRGVVVTISFAEPFETLDNTFDVPDEEKITRAIAIDRTRKIRFVFVKQEQAEEQAEDEEEAKEGQESKEDEQTEETKETKETEEDKEEVDGKREPKKAE